jgi:hypothetical protein
MSDYRRESHIPDASSRPAGAIRITLAAPGIADGPALVNTAINDDDERRSTQFWQTNLPRAVYMDLRSHANDATHPGM